MTVELFTALKDLIDGQTQLVDLMEQLAEDCAAKPGRGARPAAVPSQLVAHREKLNRAKQEIAKYI